MAIRSPERPTVEQLPPRIETLTVESMSNLRVGWWSKLDPADMRATLERYPGRSAWCPETSEYALVDGWRHRDEIAYFQDLAAPRNPEALMQGVLERVSGTDANVLLQIEIDDARRPVFYDRIGFDLIEEVIVYELDDGAGAPPPGELRFRLAKPESLADMTALLRIDNDAFPWLWRNSEREFDVYSQSPGVEVHLAERDGEVIGYIGITAYLGWGHLDRVAIAPGLQGHGYGRACVGQAIRRLRSLGAKRIGLSTQRHNSRSQRLYEALGFRRIQGSDYRLYGSVIRMPEGVDSIIE